MQYDLWQLFAVFWDEMSLNHSTKRLSPLNSAFGLTKLRDGPLQPLQSWPHVLHLAPLTLLLVLICLFTLPSPKEASYKSPLKMRTGLDSNKLEQNNLFPNPTSTPAPHLPCLFPSVPVSSAAVAVSATVRLRAVLVYWRRLYWCELIASCNTFGRHASRCLSLPSLLLIVPLPLMYLPLHSRLHATQQSCSYCCAHTMI